MQDHRRTRVRRGSSAALAVVLTVATGLLAASGAEAQTPEADLVSTFEVTLTSIDGGDEAGTATLTVLPSGVRIVLALAGASAQQEHTVALHRPTGALSRCPLPRDDVDDSGWVDPGELDRVAGPLTLALASDGTTDPGLAFTLGTAPIADDAGNLRVDRTFSAERTLRDAIGSTQLVVYGRDLNFDNRYDPPREGRPDERTLPVACGSLTLTARTLPAPYRGQTGTAGIVSRLYVALLDRAPEPAGHAAFVDAIDVRRAGPIDVVWAMAVSPEFRARFGPALEGSDADWVDFVYRAVFARQPDASGRAYWVSQLEARRVGREAMLFYFADSAEFRAITATS